MEYATLQTEKYTVFNMRCGLKMLYHFFSTYILWYSIVYYNIEYYSICITYVAFCFILKNLRDSVSSVCAIIIFYFYI